MPCNEFRRERRQFVVFSGQILDEWGMQVGSALDCLIPVLNGHKNGVRFEFFDDRLSADIDGTEVCYSDGRTARIFADLRVHKKDTLETS